MARRNLAKLTGRVWVPKVFTVKGRKFTVEGDTLMEIRHGTRYRVRDPEMARMVLQEIAQQLKEKS